MGDGSYLSWEEVQRLALPPNAAMLIPPPPEPLETAAPGAGPPHSKPDWLDDINFPDSPKPADSAPIDPEANRAAAERAEYGPGPIRFLANLIAFNAVLEYAKSPPKKDEDEDKRIPAQPRPEKP